MDQLTVTSAQMAHGLSIAMYSIGTMGIVQLVVLLLFIGSIRKTMRPVPSAQRSVPMWLLWLLLLPVVGAFFMLIGLGLGLMMAAPVVALIVAWIMIPFAVPQSLSRHYADRADLIKRARSLKHVGLWCVICFTVVILTFLGGGSAAVSQIAALQSGQAVPLISPTMAGFTAIKSLFSLGYVVLAIIYWCQIVGFRRATHHAEQSTHHGDN
jgi:hypothetical protein